MIASIPSYNVNSKARRPFIALFSQDLKGGGAEKVILNLANGFADLGVKVDLVLVRPEGPYLPMVSDKVRVVNLGTRRTVKSISALARYLRREEPEALLSALTHVNVAAILAKQLARCPTRVIISEHNFVSKNAPIEKNWLARFAFHLIPRLYPLADGIVAVSPGVARDLAHFSGILEERIETISNPITTSRILSLAEEHVDHPWFGANQLPVILGAGRLVPQKDFSTLIKAYAQVRQHCPARLVVLGEGPERRNLKKLISELAIENFVSLPGFAKNPYAPMSQANVFVLSSVWEGFGNVLVEAMACGTPVVTTDCPSGPAEIVDNGRFGQLVPVGDVHALAAAIIQTLKKPLSRELLKKRSEDFSIERSVGRYLRVMIEKEMG